MKYFLIFAVLCSSTLYAEYLRTLRIASFNTKAESQQALREVKEFISLHENITQLQNKWDFEFKARRSGKYYITLVEPFTQRKILQEVIDTLRINYPDVYVTALSKNFIKTPKVEVPLEILIEAEPIKEEIIQFEEPQSILQEIEVPEVIQLRINQDEVKINDTTQVQVEVLEELKPEVEDFEKDTSSIYVNYFYSFIWPFISFALFIIVLYQLRKIMQYKKESEIYFNTKMIHDEKYEQLSLEIKDREKYLSHASHELRTPMTSIMGLTQLVLESDLQKQDKDYIKQIESSANNLLNIVNDILDVSKIKAGGLHIEKVEFNINDILEYVLNIISMQAKNNNIKCFVDIAKDVPSHIIGDPLRLGQVLINLLSNAVKFTKDGKVSLAVNQISNHGDNVNLEFIISDDGIGMSDEQLGTVFQSFSQASESTSRKFGGTGLGLSISQELVRMMHSEIKVKSQEGQGTTFTFSLAFKLKDHLNKRQYRLPSAKLLKKRILVVDASSSNTMQLIRMLGYFKYRTHAIPSFAESIIDNDMEFDIIIINKNQLDITTIQKLQQMRKEQAIKIVILNDLFSSLNTQILKELHVDSYLKIPFNQQNVLNMIIDLYVSKKMDSKSRLKKAKNILHDVVDKKILVAEDNKVNHKVITGLLSNTGIAITYVLNGKEAVDMLLSAKEFDLILMDLNMPIMNGYEATYEIRRHKKFDTIPIIALTADVMDEAIEKVIASGMQGYISKPIILDIFYKKIYDAFHLTKIEEHPEVSKNLSIDFKEGEYSEISIEIGLERYNNDVDFYRSILKDFKKMYINSAQELEDLCRIGNYKQARFKAMDIKDVSLSIGAYKLCENAATMEYSLEKGPRSNWVNLITFYETELAKLFKDIDDFLKKSYS